MRHLDFDLPLLLDLEGESFCLPLPGACLQWNGANPVFGHLLNLVDNSGMRLHADDAGVAIERLGPTKFKIHNSFPTPGVELTVVEKDQRTFLLMQRGYPCSPRHDHR
jgi:hypothetical protein